MKTKLLFLSAIMFVMTSALQAQVQFGVSAGINLQNINGTGFDGEKLDNGLLFGFHGGVNAIIPFAPDFYFQPGLLYSLKGSKNNFGPLFTKAASDDYSTTTKLSYIELPLNLLYKPKLGPGHIMIGFGPYIAMGIAGTQCSDLFDQKVKFRKSITESDYSSEEAYFRPFDMGANIYFGYELDMGLFVQLNTQLGLVNIQTEFVGLDGDERNYKNTGFGLSAGYRF